MKDQPREQKAPDGADQPTVEHPTGPSATAAATQPTTGTGAPRPAAAGQRDSSPRPGGRGPAGCGPAAPAAERRRSARPPAGTTLSDAGPPADQTAVHGQQPPPAPPAAFPARSRPPLRPLGPPQATQRPPGGFRRFVGHRATQLVGVGVLGMLLGAGIVGGSPRPRATTVRAMAAGHPPPVRRPRPGLRTAAVPGSWPWQPRQLRPGSGSGNGI